MEVFKLILGLGAVGFLMYFAWRKASKMPGFGASGHLKIVERHQVSRNSSLVVFRDGDDRVVIGASDHGIVELSRKAWPADTESESGGLAEVGPAKKFASTLSMFNKK